MSKIALVDDDQNIQESLCRLFEAEGYEVEAYFDSIAALCAMQKSPPDVAIFDMAMPHIDGLELLRRLREEAD